jgi:hypothetical protein
MYLRTCKSFNSVKKLSANRKIHNLHICKFPRKRLGSQILNSQSAIIAECPQTNKLFKSANLRIGNL